MKASKVSKVVETWDCLKFLVKNLAIKKVERTVNQSQLTTVPLS